MKLNMVIGAFGALAITAAALAPQAHADESTFLEDIANAGLPADATALTVGYQICSDMSSRGVAGADAEAKLGMAVGFSADEVATLIVESVYELCPSNMSTLHAWEYSGPSEVA